MRRLAVSNKRRHGINWRKGETMEEAYLQPGAPKKVGKNN